MGKHEEQPQHGIYPEVLKRIMEKDGVDLDTAYKLAVEQVAGGDDEHIGPYTRAYDALKQDADALQNNNNTLDQTDQS